jgi:TRAP-type uncharacterized transport system fused permease subunit
MSMITPPIAIAAFAAASIANADAAVTGLQAMRFGWIAFVIPFVFILSPDILLRGDWLGIGLAVMGVWFGSIASAGYFSRLLGTPLRIVFAALAMAVLFPSDFFEAGRLTNLAALASGCLIMAWLWRAGVSAKHEAEVGAVAARK